MKQDKVVNCKECQKMIVKDKFRKGQGLEEFKEDERKSDWMTWRKISQGEQSGGGELKRLEEDFFQEVKDFYQL